MWLRKSKVSSLCQMIRNTAALSQQSIEACNKAVAQVEQLTALNTKLVALLSQAPDFAIIIQQANEDALRATAMREHSEFVESLLKMLCCAK